MPNRRYAQISVTPDKIPKINKRYEIEFTQIRTYGEHFYGLHYKRKIFLFTFNVRTNHFISFNVTSVTIIGHDFKKCVQNAPNKRFSISAFKGLRKSISVTAPNKSVTTYKFSKNK